LLPSPPVLLYLPSINDISHQIQDIAGVVFEEVVEAICLTVSRAKVHVGDEY
jgi:hypothetical protein